ncbi:MAG TPA: ABC transporter permease [Bryobacteraceae bacterium]|nr:ABC transporter permease [Bryobacteraceae bacterium]
MINSYLAMAAINLKLTFRDRTVIFFNYLFPLVFFFIFAQLYHAEQGGAIIQVLTMVLNIGILGSGFFGAGIRAVQERETNILRRFKVAPISAAPILVASLVTGLLNFVPSAVMMVLLSHFIYGMEFPERWFSLLIFVAIGAMAFRSLGLVIASVVNSMQESQIVIQLLYFPMLFLSGTTIPLSVLPNWVQILAQFLPATHLMTGMQAILGRNETLAQNASAVGALLLTIVLATFIGVKLFRWEKEEKIAPSAKLWLVAVLTPFLILGVYQAYSKDSVVKARLLSRDLQRSRSLLIRDARIFIGDGRVIETGGVLVKNGKIEKIFEGSTPDAKELKAEAIEAAGKTLLPGLIDTYVNLAESGGFTESPASEKTLPRELAAYLYSGITAVKTGGLPAGELQKVRTLVNSGERLGAELFLFAPASDQQMSGQRSVDGVQVALSNSVDLAALRAMAGRAQALKLPFVVRTNDGHEVEEALAAGVNGIENGSSKEKLADALFAQMKSQAVAYTPALISLEGLTALINGAEEPLDRPLVLQAGPAALITSTKAFLKSEKAAQLRAQLKQTPVSLDLGKENLAAAWKAGVFLVAGSGAGTPLTLHGPTIQREVELWVEAGVPPAIALQAATYNAAKLLGAADRIGLIREGQDANLLLVDGNPLKEIKQLESIQTVILKGERISRSELFEQE